MKKQSLLGLKKFVNSLSRLLTQHLNLEYTHCWVRSYIIYIYRHLLKTEGDTVHCKKTIRT